MPAPMWPPEEPTLVALRQVGWLKNRRTVVSELDIAIERGEWISIIGPNGGGKTSAIRILLGLEMPTWGERWVRPHLRLGYVPQSLQVDPSLPLTVQGFLKLFVKPVPPSGDMQWLLPWLGMFPVTELLPRMLAELSRGQWQIVLLLRALLQKPDVLVLDEPTQGLDVHAEARYYETLESIRKKKEMAVCVVSHDLHWVMAQTDRVYCINRHICCAGAPGTLVNEPAYQRLFSPYRHQHDHHHDT